MKSDKLLIVDDDEEACSSLFEILTDLGYAVDVAYREGDALLLIEYHDYSLAVLKYRLPHMTGVELFRRMRRIRDNVQAFLVTDTATEETLEEALIAGLRHVVEQPVDVPQLTPLIEQIFIEVREKPRSGDSQI